MNIFTLFSCSPAEQRFQRSRQVMLRDLTAWLETNPLAEDVEQEVSGTIAACQQLQLLQPYLTGEK